MNSRWHTAFQTLQAEPGGTIPGLALRAGATFLSTLYGLGAWGRRRLYDRGWRQPKRLPAPVLSLGNLVVGGVGKTPLTAFLAGRFQAAGCRVVILSRGYGGEAPGINVVSDGRRIFLQPPQAGDEAYLLAQKLPGIPVVTGIDRYQAGLHAWEAFRPDLFLLDDGFQHFQLDRDLDVVLLDAARPFGNGRLLPRGPLREPVSTLHRPLVLVLTRYEPDQHQQHLGGRPVRLSGRSGPTRRVSVIPRRQVSGFPEGEPGRVNHNEPGGHGRSGPPGGLGRQSAGGGC